MTVCRFVRASLESVARLKKIFGGVCKHLANLILIRLFVDVRLEISEHGTTRQPQYFNAAPKLFEVISPLIEPWTTRGTWKHTGSSATQESRDIGESVSIKSPRPRALRCIGSARVTHDTYEVVTTK